MRLTPAFDAIDRESERNPDVAIDPHNLAYSIWTSGSTGKPKGAMNTHASLMNILRWMEEAHPLEPGDRVLQKTAFNFDVSILEFFCPLIAGATLVIAKPGGHRDPQYLAALMADERVSVVHFVPSMLDAFLQAREIDRCASLRTVICIGEAVTPALSASSLHAALLACTTYGPAGSRRGRDPLAVQRADTATVLTGLIANTQIHVLDGSFQATPVGVPAIYIGGATSAAAISAALISTADRFVPDPFSIVPGSRPYRTGDRARRSPDGTLEFLGRRDYQVKIRGNSRRARRDRIRARRSSRGADRRRRGERRCGAAGRGRYYVPNGGASCDAIELRDYLERGCRTT